MTLTVREISSDAHLAFVDERSATSSVSFLQCPSWAGVKSEWLSASLGWYDDAGPAAGSQSDRSQSDGSRSDAVLVGVGLVLLRPVPRTRRYLAYLPEGPVLDWGTDDLAAWLDPLVAHLRGRGAFGITIGPPVVRRRWSAATVKAALAGETAGRLTDVPADHTDPAGDRVATALTRLGWRPPAGGAGFAKGQPQFVFQVPLAGRDEADLLRGLNQLWRRNIKKADKLGVTVRQGSADDLAAFHALYLETAARDHFTGRPLSYFQQMWAAMRAEDPDRVRLYLAEHEGDLVAATTMVRVGTHAWYSYGASSTAKREVRGSNAVQWAMMRDALAAGATVYDLRGITDTLDADDPHLGLIQFKLGTGGAAVEYLGEWSLPLNRLLYKAFELYLGFRALPGSSMKARR